MLGHPALQKAVKVRPGPGVKGAPFGFEFVSLNFCHIFRCSKLNMTGQPTRLIYPSDEAFQAIVRQARPAITADGVFDTELQLIRRSGETFWARMRGRSIAAGDPSKGTIWTIEDVTAMRSIPTGWCKALV